MKRRFKGLVAINDVLDDRYQKLSDRYHNLELSHNRKRNALLRIKKILESLEYDSAFNAYFIPADSVYEDLVIIIDDALFCDGRERCKK